MTVKLLTEHHLEFLSLKGGCTGSSESTHVKMPLCWESHALAQIVLTQIRHQRMWHLMSACTEKSTTTDHFSSHVVDISAIKRSIVAQ